MQSTSINERVEKAKNSIEETDRLIEEYKPFIASCVEKTTGRYMRYGEDDELSIALIAFAEAIKYYDSSKGSFLAFAQSVIKRRLIDYYRKEKKHSNVISLNECYNEDDLELDYSIAESMEKYSREEISEYRRLELEELKKQLHEWDITFMQLAEASPKHDKTRKLYKEMIAFLLSKPDIVQQIINKKYVPIAEIEKSLGIPRKKVERARKYIVAAIIIATGDYQYIRDYLE